MGAKLEEITAVFVREFNRFGDVCLAEVQPPANTNGDQRQIFDDPHTPNQTGLLTIKGPADPDELQPFSTYRFYGKWTVYRDRRQFHFSTFVRAQPHGRAGIIRYLQQAPHIGHARALLLWDKFNSDAVRILRENPDVAAAALSSDRQFTEAKAREAAACLALDVALESCTIDLIDLLGGRGFPKTTTKKAVQRWGNRAAEFIRRDPYLLMAFRGCGFKSTDKMYLEMGGDPRKTKRIALAAWYSMARDTDGHSWFPLAQAKGGIKANVGGVNLTEESIAHALAVGKRAGILAEQHRDGKIWMTEGKRAVAELRIVEYVSTALAEDLAAWPAVDAIDGLSDHQREKLAAALTGMIGLFTGSPGTGKTYSVACLARLLVALFGEESIAIAAPTGKAAVRCTEALAGYGLSLKATTIHSLLGVAQRDENAGNGEGWGFQHCESNPLPHKFIVVDESSMIDTALMASLLAARAKGTHVLFVGDPNQLPPVGHGAPLRDFIAAGLPCGELREIRRNSGTIVRACAQIRDGQAFTCDREIDLAAEPAKNLAIVPAGTPEAQTAEIFKALADAQTRGLNPVWDCQILVAVNAKSPLSRRELNQVLQRELNKSGKKAGGNPFLVGDKIVCLKNGFLPLHEDSPECETSEDGKVFVANGELAEVVDVEEKLTVAKLSSPPRLIKIPRGDGGSSKNGDGEGGEDEAASATGCQWDLGYALSVHKSQGSEWPVILYMIDEYPGARMVCSREHIYTGISRAKLLCKLIGKKHTADGFCRRVALHNRKTFLKELIQERMHARQMELIDAALA